MKLYSRDYIKEPPTPSELEEYEKIRSLEVEKIGKKNMYPQYPKAVRHYESLFPNNYVWFLDFKNEGNMGELNDEFDKLVHDTQTNERDILHFINHTPAYHIIGSIFDVFFDVRNSGLPFYKYGGFGHHKAYIFPEFFLDASNIDCIDAKYLKADYLLVGSGSGGYEFIFVELEHPNGKTRLKDGYKGEAQRKGENQIDDWRTILDANFNLVSNEISRYSNKPSELPDEFIKYDSTRFHYVVVAGKREDYNEVTYRNRRRTLKERGIEMLHYDNLIDKANELLTSGKLTF